MDCGPPDSSVLGGSPGKNTGVDCHALLQKDLPNPGIESRSPPLQADSLQSETPGSPRNKKDDDKTQDPSGLGEALRDTLTMCPEIGQRYPKPYFSIFFNEYSL